jgi:crotonobetainyl-CoA:carnitine CoA-transferase CaiB-like acyl-CoA transferase
MGYKLLEGIRVLDLTMVFAGPLATKILTDLGAEVIKIESTVRADVFTRANVYPENEPGEEPWNRGCIFHSINAGKRGISLNLGSEEGREIFKRLVKISDVVIENFSPRVMENWGLSYKELKKIEPDIIMVSISGLGHYGPLRDFYMYVPGMEGMSGLAYNTGYPDEPPLQSGYAYGDWVTGVNAAAALFIALYYRHRTGKGQYVDVAGREAVSCHIGEIIMDYTLNGRDPMRAGNRHPTAAPHGCYRCKGEDSWVNIAVENDEQWQRFCQALGNPEWTKSERFTEAQSRWQNQEDLDRLVEEWTSQHDHYEVMHILQKAGVPSGAVLNMKEVNLDPQLVERGFFQVIDHGEGIGKRPLASHLPAKFSGIESFVHRRAPRFGQDNQYVYGNLLGMSKGEIAKLEEEKVIGGTPTFPPGRPTRTDLIEKQKAGWFDPDYLSELRKRYGEDIGLTGTDR